MIEAWGVLQEQGLDAADRCLPAAQCQEMRSVLTKWSSGASNAEELLRTGPPRFEELASKSAVDGQKGSLLGAIGLDPLDSLEPAARELARTRELGERAVFLAQRMPRTLEWRTELLALHAARQPALTSLLQNVERTTTAAQDAVATADALPKKLREEGDALITRVSSELAVQREGLVKDFERISAPTKELLAQLQQTLDAATRLSQSLDTTTKTVDTFIANVTAPSPQPATPKEPEPPGKPFDPNEYTQLATQVTGTLHELNTAVTGLDRSLPALQRTVEESAARVDSSVKRAWGLAIWLVLIAVVAVSAAVVLVRSISSRRQPA
jgi:hypothetical protein